MKKLELLGCHSFILLLVMQERFHRHVKSPSTSKMKKQMHFAPERCGKMCSVGIARISCPNFITILCLVLSKP